VNGAGLIYLSDHPPTGSNGVARQYLEIYVMASWKTSTRSVIFVVLFTITSGCSTMRPVTATDAESLATQVAVGDKIEVERRDGGQVKFKVTEVSPDGLRGTDVFVPITDIGRVHIVEPIQPGVVALFVVLGAAAVYMVLEGDDCGDYWWQESCDYY
jgi:hypothetical protein